MLHNFELNYKIELDAMVIQLKITNDDIIYSKGDKTKCVIVNSIDNKMIFMRICMASYGI